MKYWGLVIFVLITGCQLNSSVEHRSIGSLAQLTWKSESDNNRKLKPLKITHVNSDIDIDYVELEFVFSQDMQRVATENIQYQISPNLPCLWYWTDTRHLTCSINDSLSLQPATKYELTIENGLYSANGEKLAPYSYQFKSQHPKIDYYDVKWLAPETLELSVNFNMGVNKESLENKLYLRDLNGNIVFLSAFLNKNNKVSSVHPERIKNSSWLLKPINKLKKNTVYHLYQAEGISTPHGKLASQHLRLTDKYNKIKTYGAFKYIGNHCNVYDTCPPNYGQTLTFSTPIAPVELGKCETELQAYDIKLSTFKNNSNRIAITPSHPESTVTLKCFESIKDIFGRRLTQGSQVKITTGDYIAFHNTLYTSETLTMNDKLKLNHQTVNHDEIDVNFIEYNFSSVNDKKLKHKNLKVNFKKNITSYTNLLPEKLKSAISVGGVVSTNKINSNAQPFFIQKSNYNAIVQNGGNNLLLFISNIYNNKPLSNTRFTVNLTDQKHGKLIVLETQKAKTNHFGVALIPKFKKASTLDRYTSLVFKLSNDEQFSVRNEHRLSPKIINEQVTDSNREDNSKVFWGITQKPLYRPGETVKFTGFVRQLNGIYTEITKLPQNTLLYVDGQNIDCYSLNRCDSFHINKNVKQNKYGQITGEFKLPASVSDGRYVISLDTQNYDNNIVNKLFFDVANFKKQSIKVSVEPEVNGILTEEQLKIKSKAQYYSGGPYSAANIEVGVTISNRDFNKVLKGYEKFYFEANQTSESSNQDNYYFNGGRLNPDGESSTSIVIPPNNINYGTIEVTASLTTDEGEKVFSRGEEVTFSRRGYYVGIEKLDWWLPANKKIALKAVVIGIDGQVKQDVNINYFIRKIDHFWERSSNKLPTEKKLVQCLTDKDLSGLSVSIANQCLFTHQKTGYYQLIAELVYPDGSIQNSKTTHYFYNNAQTDNGLVVQATKETLKVGDKAKLKIKHNLKEAAALVTIHRGKLLDYWWQPLANGINELSFDVKENYAPGFDVTIFVNYGDLTEEKSKKHPDLAQVITQRFKVEPPSIQPLVLIESISKSFKPGENITVSLKNITQKKASVVLALIDESIIDQLKNNEYFKIEKSYLSSNELIWDSPKLYEITKRLYASQYKMPPPIDTGEQKIVIVGSRISGNNDELDYLMVPEPVEASSTHKKSKQPLKLRQLFKESVYWNSQIIVNANSTQDIKIKLPDNLTQWKIIALSTNQTGEMFGGYQSIQTAKAIEVHGQMPSQVTRGDHFEFQADLISKNDKIKQLSITSSARLMPINKQIKQTSKIFTGIKPYERNKIKMNLKASNIGQLQVLTVAQSNLSTQINESDAIKLTTQIYSKNLKRTQSYYSVLPEETQINIDTPNYYSKNNGKLYFSLSGSIISSLTGAFNYMKEYPHQCWEQKLSRALVASINQAARKNIKKTNSEDTTKITLEAQINDAITAMDNFQASNGGMAFFGKSEGYVNVFLSAYTYKVIQYLNQQNSKKFPKSNIEKLRIFLIRLLESKHITLEQASIILNALASNVENKSMIFEYLPSLILKYTELDIFSKSQVLEAASHYSKFNSDIARLQSLLLESSRVTRKKRIFKSNQNLPWFYFDFSTKKYCSTISSLIAAKTSKKAVNQFVNSVLDLRRKLKGDFGNTLSNAYCSIAINDYVKTYEKNSSIGSFNLSVQDLNVKISQKENKKASGISLEKPLLVDIDIKRSGFGYLQTTLEYMFDATQTPPESNGLTIERQYFVNNNGLWTTLDKKSLKQGDFVKVKLKIHTSLPRRYVAITDTLPGTFFALDEKLSTNAPAELFKKLSHNYYFREKQLSSRNAKFYADYLPAGIHTIEYLVKTTHKGQFSALSAKIEEMYDDDVFATSKSHIIKVD
ncbi:alpha-2-macroglobulin family protein [Aliikangiella sp. IMCC44359]|uniref:alpha-2-macroglobulin family protein n=1 Tax=Aliikangiella sp. IMCC44359 TaxID=3459125 RepID=UPI00403B2B30